MTFISKVKQGAINGWHTHQILPSISIAQAILESASGTSTLGAKYNNLFGIKASEDWTGKVINLPTREYGANGSYQVNANFRWYDSWADSMLDHAAFFTNTPWREINYAAVVGERDYKKAAQALQSAGYATDPQYATKLIQRIEQNNLTQYDTEAFNGQPSNVGVIKKVVGGTLTEIAKSAVKQYNVTLIGDSLGVGTQPKLTGVFKSFTHDVLGSRQITHATNSLNGTYVLQSLKDYGQLKDIVVVILGTNRGVTDTEIDNFVAIAGSSRKVIFVDTNSQVAHRQSISDAYRRASERHNNLYHANWMTHSNSLRSRYYGSDNIHMTNEGYQAHADFIKMAVYEAGVGVKTTPGTIGTLTEYIGIEDIDYKDGDLVSPKGESIIYNHPANELWGSKTGDKVIWIESILEVDSDDTQFILETAVKVMKENGQPAAQYVVDLAELPDDVSIGDWGYVLDHEFNPPLYIHARVLEIITSETDLNANKAVIGNVTEVFPADKSDIKLIQADLKDVRDNLVRDYRNGQPILMLVNSTNGSTLGDKYTETELVAKVTQGAEDLTNHFITYKWERVSNDTISDDAYNAIIETETTNRLIITSKDIVNNLSTFVVRVYDGDNLINQSSITIKHVDTALWTDTNTPPSDAKEGATWVDESGKHWILKDGEWEERVDQAQIFSVRSEVEGAIAEAEQAKKDAQQAYENAVADAKQAADEADALIRAEIEQGISAVNDELSTAKQEAINAFNKALTDAKAHAIAQDTALKSILQNDINEVGAEALEAKQEAQNAYTNAVAEAEAKVQAKDAEYKLIFDGYDAQVVQIEADAQSAQSKADQALTEAGISTDLAQTAKDLATTAQSNASTAISNANQAKADASTAITQAGQAVSSANTAKTNAQTAINNAQSALTEAGNAKTTADTLSVKVDDLEGEVELKASQTEVDGISGTVSTHTSTLSQHATQIASKAESGLVNTIKNTVDTHTTEITQNATDIASKASSSSVNTLTGRVSTAESTITQQAGLIASKASQTEVDGISGTVSSHTSTLSQHASQISARLTSSQVNSLVDGKGFSTVNYVDNQITASASGIRSDMSVVEGKIPLDTNDKNYLTNSETEWATTSTASNSAYGVYRLGQGVTDMFKELVGQIKISVDVFIENAELEYASFRIYGINRAPRYVLNNLTINNVKTNEWVRISGTTDIVDEGAGGYGRIEIFGHGVPSTTKIRVRKMKIGKVYSSDTWSPAPEDTMMENDFNIFKASYEATAESLTSRLTAVDKVGGRLETAETSISQNATAIASKASQAEVDTVKGTVSNHTSTLSQHAQAIEARLTSSQVNNLVDGKGLAQVTYVDNQISATADGITANLSSIESEIENLMAANLAVDTTDVWQTIEWTAWNYWINSNLSATGGETYTLSVTAKDANYNIGLSIFEFDDNNTKLRENNNPYMWWNTLTGEHRKSLSVTLLPNTTRIWIGFRTINMTESITKKIAYKEFTLNKGSKSYPWNRNAEDLLTKGSFDLFKAEYQVTSQGFSAEISRVENKIPSLSGYATTTYVGTQIASKAGEILAEVSKVEGKVITSNLHPNTSDQWVTRTWNAQWNVYINDGEYGALGNPIDIPVTAGETYTASANYSSVQTHSVGVRIMWYASDGSVVETPTSEVIQPGQSGWASVTAEAPHWAVKARVSLRRTAGVDGGISRANVRYVKFEKNGSRTEWEPAWQDNASLVALSKLEIDLSGVRTTVQDNQGSISTLAQQANALIANIGSSGEKIAQMVMTDSLFQTSVAEVLSGNLATVAKADWETYEWVGWNGIIDSGIPVEPSTLYTLSATGKDASGNLGLLLFEYDANGVRTENFVTSNWWQSLVGERSVSVSWTTKPTTVTVQIGFRGSHNEINYPHRITYKEYQLEKGHKTPWTPPVAGMSTKVAQLNNSWALTLKSGNDIKTQINASTNSIRLASKFIHLSGTSLIDDAVIKSAHIDSLNANKITGNTADFNTIRAGVLTANAVTSTHINANTALFDKLFSTTSATTRLVAQGAWITDANIISLNASKITAGTIDTARLDASAIVTKGLTANVVQASHILANDALIDNIFATQALVDRLWAKSIWTSKINTMSLDAARITSGTISAARLNVSDIVTKGLTANVVTSTHIKADTALFDTLFSTASATNRLVAQGAWITNANIISLNADKITAGTISADRISTNSLANVEVGGRNLLIQSKSLVGFIGGNGVEERDDNRYNSRYVTANYEIKVTAGEYLTWTKKSVSGDNFWRYKWMGSSGGYISRHASDLNKFSIIVPPGAVALRVSYPVGSEPKIERGVVATAYSLSPEDNATKDELAQSGTVEIHGGNIKADTLDVGAITGDKASFLSLSFESLNSNMKLNSGAIRIQNSAGDFATMNTIPEFRSQDSSGTAAIMGKGRSHYYSGNQARFYIGSNLEGLAQYGVHIAKGQTWGIYRNSDTYGGTPAQYHTVLQGEHWRSITTKYWNDSTSVNVLMQLNGYNVNNYPVLQPGDVLLIKAAVPGNESGVERIWTMGTASNGTTRVYSHVHHVFEGGTTGTSDERMKHNIEPTEVEALPHIEALTFKQFNWNRDNKFEPLGLIAQHSGILRVPDEDMEGIDIQRALMLALKGIQELQEKIKQLKGA